MQKNVKISRTPWPAFSIILLTMSLSCFHTPVALAADCAVIYANANAQCQSTYDTAVSNTFRSYQISYYSVRYYYTNELAQSFITVSNSYNVCGASYTNTWTNANNSYTTNMLSAEALDTEARGKCLADNTEDTAALTRCFCEASANRARLEADAFRILRNRHCQAGANATSCKRDADKIQHKSDNESNARQQRDTYIAEAILDRDNQKSSWDFLKCASIASGNHTKCWALLIDCDGPCYAALQDALNALNTAYCDSAGDAYAAYYYAATMAESARVYADLIADANKIFTEESAQATFGSISASLDCDWQNFDTMSAITEQRNIAVLDCRYPSLSSDPDDPDVIAYNTTYASVQAVREAFTATVTVAYWANLALATTTRDQAVQGASGTYNSTCEENMTARNRAVATALETFQSAMVLAACVQTAALFAAEVAWNICMDSLICSRGS